MQALEMMDEIESVASARVVYQPTHTWSMRFSP